MSCESMYNIDENKLKDAMAYFRLVVPEMASLSDEMFMLYAKRSLMYIPAYVFRGCNCWDLQKEIICQFVAHWVMLFALMDNVDESGKPQLVDIRRTAQSLSEGGLSVSYAEVQPVGTAPHVLYDWLSRTAYGELVKMLLEKCLSGAKGVFCV